MLQETEVAREFYQQDEASEPPFDPARWKVLFDKTIDYLRNGDLKALAKIAGVDEGTLRLFYGSPDALRRPSRRVMEKSRQMVIAEALEQHFSMLESIGFDPRLRCPVRVETSAGNAVIGAIGTARAMCETIEVSAPAGTCKTEAKEEYLAITRKAEGLFCPVWSITLDDACISIKAVLSLICKELAVQLSHHRSYGHYNEKDEFSMVTFITENAVGKGGVLIVDEVQHLADAQKKNGIPVVNMLRTFVDRKLFGVVLLGNGELYRRLTTSKGAYAQLLSRMQDFRVEILGLNAEGTGALSLTKADVYAVAAAWGVSGVEAYSYCVTAASQPGALRTMTNIFRKALIEFDDLSLASLKKIRSF